MATSDPTAVKATKGEKAPDHGDISDLENTAPDPRLDNRRGSQRPPLEDFPAKPQQIDGGDLSNIPSSSKEVDAAVKAAEKEDKVNRKGAQSPGPVGLGEDVGGENTTGT